MSPELTELCKRASVEHDSAKLLELVTKINHLFASNDRQFHALKHAHKASSSLSTASSLLSQSAPAIS